MPQAKTILGIDPGIADTGYGVVYVAGQKLSAGVHGSIKTKAGLPMADRLAQLYTELSAIIKKASPDVFAIEQLFFSQNVTTAMAVSQARGVALLCAAQHHVPVVEFTGLQVKVALSSYGRASKRQMQEMVKVVLGLKAIPKPDDAADALAIAICAAHRR